MSETDRKPGVRDEYLVRRRLKLGDLERVDVAALLNDIDQLPGPDHASLREDKRVLSVAYDASRTSIEQVEEVLLNHRCELSHGWWNRFKEGWYRLTDANIKANSKHEPLSCHKTPS